MRIRILKNKGKKKEGEFHDVSPSEGKDLISSGFAIAHKMITKLDTFKRKK